MLSINNTTEGYLKNVEIKGNTIQDSLGVGNLADIKSVGDKVEGQDLYEIPLLSVGKNLFDGKFESGGLNAETGIIGGGNFTRTELLWVGKNANIVLSDTSTIGWIVVFEYDKNGNPIKQLQSITGRKQINFITTNGGYIRIRFDAVTIEYMDGVQIQLEQGTQATTYEPYQENKLTILSPVQLEKVGDVADRIVEKDGVWGVEKNVNDFIIPSNVNWSSYASGIGENLICATSAMLPSDMDEIVRTESGSAISEKFLVLRGNSVAILIDKGIYLRTDSNMIFIKDEKTKYASYTELGKSVEGSIVKYPTTTPTFIPLPHSQQIKLRTFANRTNISFLCEIEG
ncbi:MAG: hypothetical protein ACRC7S_18725, partial [Cetobacterium sp.]